MHHTPVLIVGGSLVGLSASLFLSMRGVPHVLVEKHAGSSPHPRAIGFTEHTLEFYRAAGIGARIAQAPPHTRLRRVRADALAGQWSEVLPWTPGHAEAAPGTYSPCTGAAIAQDRLEPILREAAAQRGADLRYRHRLLSWHPAGEGVLARIADHDTGDEYGLQVDYLLACDGADSPIREQAGITRSGVGHLRTVRSVLFRCAAADAYLERGVQQFEIEQPGLRAFLTTYGDGRWVLMFDDDRARGEPELGDAVRAALGGEFPFETLATGRWEMAGRIADSYRSGRVFLLGDAAHQLPPTRGGFGANTGIDDAYNLAWKLRLVLDGTSDPRLLDSYDSERRPIGWLRHQQTFARPDYARWLDRPVESALYSNAAMELGQLQRSAILLEGNDALPPAAEPDAWRGQPGTRAPHAWVRRGEERISTIDLFARRFALVSESVDWIAAAREASAALGLAVDTVHVGTDVRFDSAAGFRDAFGVTAQGASLVRPDGVVAWRSPGQAPDPVACMAGVLRQAACLRG